MRPRARVRDAGETLVELVVSIAIMGIAGVAIMAGLQMTVLGATLGRGEANGEAYVRSAAEAIQGWVANGNGSVGGHYATCATAQSTYVAKGQAAIDAAWHADPKNGSATPDPYALTIVPATTGGAVVQSWSNSAAGGSWVTCSDTGYAQLFQLKVAGPGSGGHQPVERLTVIVRRPCTGQTWTTVC